MDKTTFHVPVIDYNRNRHIIIAVHCVYAIVDRKLWTGRPVGDHQPALHFYRRIVHAHLLGNQPAAYRLRCFCTRRARPSLFARISVSGRYSVRGCNFRQISLCSLREPRALATAILNIMQIIEEISNIV